MIYSVCSCIVKQLIDIIMLGEVDTRFSFCALAILALLVSQGSGKEEDELVVTPYYSV